MAEKRYYWIKLKESFMTSDTVDFLMGQPNGAEYVVLYQMLCLRTLNSAGVLARRIGEILIPYDEHKIQRDCKYFSLDTIIVALELYKKLGLVYAQEDGYLKIANYENIIGSESSSAARVRALRERDRNADDSTLVSENALHCNAECNTDVTNRALHCNTQRNEDVTADTRDRNTRDRSSLLKIERIKKVFARMGAYMGTKNDVLVDEIAEALGEACCMNGTLTFDGVAYDMEKFENVTANIDIESICNTVTSILSRKDAIADRKYYILGAIVKQSKYVERRRGIKGNV